MAKYYLAFTKLNDMKYISHLDLLRLFKRAFRSAEIRLIHSEGFNPHPRLSFGQPLSLGYESLEEWIEVETKLTHEVNDLKDTINNQLPEGITIIEVKQAPSNQKPLAATCWQADYIIKIPLKADIIDLNTLGESFLKQPEILVNKESKKNREIKAVNIKAMIKYLKLDLVDNNLIMQTTLDAGSNSNLSPELLLQAFLSFSGLTIPRHEIEVMRIKLRF